MPDFPRHPGVSGPCAQSPERLHDGVIAHMITLIEDAANAGFPGFEAKLIDATETLIEELNEKGLAPHNRPAATEQPAGNVVEFPGASPAPRAVALPVGRDTSETA